MSDMLRAGCVAIAASSLAFSACLVTTKVDYDQAIVPSQVERIDPRPEEFVYVPDDPDEECAREGAGHMRLGIQISDLNLEESLQVRVTIDKDYFKGYDVAANGDKEREPLHFCIPESRLRQPCSLVEALVASRFATPTDPPDVTRDGDLASAHWWVIGKAVDNTYASFQDCPNYLPDGGFP
jgi:hypothetical protein